MKITYNEKTKKFTKKIKENSKEIIKEFDTFDDYMAYTLSGGKWMPKEGDGYYYGYIDCGDYYTVAYKDFSIHSSDFDRLYDGNCFKTEKEALANETNLRKQLARGKAIWTVSSYIEKRNAELGWNADWLNSSQAKILIIWEHHDKELCTNTNYRSQLPSVLPYTNEQIAKEIIGNNMFDEEFKLIFEVNV